MLREYEMTFITRSDLPEADFNGVLAKYEKYMTADGGEILKKEAWGSRKLAFPINKQHRGNFMVYDFAGLSSHLTEMERLMRIDENVLRYLSVLINKQVVIEKRKDEIVKEAIAAKEREAAAREAAEELGGRD
jgi:small subunit ribosomal protein S6